MPHDRSSPGLNRAVEKKLLAQLRDGAELSTPALAAVVGLTEAAVEERLRHLAKDELIVKTDRGWRLNVGPLEHGGHRKSRSQEVTPKLRKELLAVTLSKPGGADGSKPAPARDPWLRPVSKYARREDKEHDISRFG
jgi:hypothetical protein